MNTGLRVHSKLTANAFGFNKKIIITARIQGTR